MGKTLIMRKFINIISIIILVQITFVAFTPRQLYGAPVSETPVFMDLESSIKALQLKVENARKSIVTVVVYNSSGLMKSGSGLFIDNEGRIITNALILKDAYSAEIFSETRHYKQVDILNQRKDIDIALIQVKANNEIPIELDHEFKIDPGKRVVVVGKSSNFRTTASEGLITEIKSIEDISDYIEIETTKGLLSYRYSIDGPVINMDGKVIGITVKDVYDFGDELFPKDYNRGMLYAVSVRSINALIVGPYKIERLHPAGAKIWSNWFLRKIKEYAFSSFFTLYSLRFTTVVAIVLVLIVLILCFQWLFRKFRKIISRK